MRVRCKNNRGDDLSLPYFNPNAGRPSGQIFPLTVGRSYNVYALGVNGPGTWVYVADDVFVDGPRRYPLCLFDIEDGSVSQSWVFDSGRQDSDQPEMLAPLPWLKMDWFFNRVVDGETGAVKAFAEMKRRIDEEFTGVGQGSDGGPDRE